MIIATAFKSLFEGLTVNVSNEGTPVERGVNFHYGDQKELNLWVKLRGNLEKYPLIWYVLSPYTELNGWYETSAKLLVMQKTKSPPLNTWRRDNSYIGIIDPVWTAAKDLIEQNQYIETPSVNLKDRFRIKDEPNFGINGSFDSGEVPSGEQSVTTDIVDARVIRFNLRIKANCIIN